PGGPRDRRRQHRRDRPLRQHLPAEARGHRPRCRGRGQGVVLRRAEPALGRRPRDRRRVTERPGAASWRPRPGDPTERRTAMSTVSSPVRGAAARSTALPAPAPRRRGPGRGWKVTPWLFLLVPLGLLVLFTYVPVANMVWYSFTSWDGMAPVKEPVGLDNYQRIFTDPDMFSVFLVSLYYLAGAFLQLVLALYFATVLSFRTRVRNLFKGIMFFPYLINGVAIGLVFLFFLRPGGTLDAVLALVGVAEPPQWLGDPDLANISLASTSVWRYMGLNFVLFLGAIQSIP